MCEAEGLYNLYLFYTKNPKNLYLIKGLSYDTAFEAAHRWVQFKSNGDTDYMLVTEDSKPYDESSIITEVSLNWINSQ